MIPAELQTCENELRKAVARRQYDDVDHRMEDLRRAADRRLKLTADPAARHEIAAWILATIEWTRTMVVTQRQNWAEELGQLPQVDRFIESPGTANGKICLDL